VGSWVIPQLFITSRHSSYCQVVMLSDSIVCHFHVA
jgi:hypothetical protein